MKHLKHLEEELINLFINSEKRLLQASRLSFHPTQNQIQLAELILELSAEA